MTQSTFQAQNWYANYVKGSVHPQLECGQCWRVGEGKYNILLNGMQQGLHTSLRQEVMEMLNLIKNIRKI